MDEPSKRRLRAFAAWGVIIVIVALAIWGQSRRTAPTEGAPSAPALRKQFLSTAKSTIGIHLLVPTMAVEALPVLDWMAQTPDLKMQTAIVAAEVVGKEAALERLSKIDVAASEDQARDVKDLRLAIEEGGTLLDEQSRQRIVDRFGFLGELATTFGRDNSDPTRATLLSQCRRLAILLLAGEAFAGLLGLTGLILLIIAVVLWFEGRLRPAYVPRQDDDPVWLEVFAAFMVVQMVTSVIMWRLFAGAPLLVSWLCTAPLALLAAMGVAAFRGVSRSNLCFALGLYRGRGPMREAISGVIGYVAGMPIIFAGFAITLFLIRLSPAPPSHPLLGEPMNSVWNILPIYLLASVGAPVIEEIVFRGALFHHLRKRLSGPLAALLIAFIFAAIHPQGWTTIPALGAIAMVLAGLREWRGSLIAPIVAHGLSNGLVVTLSLLVQ